MSPIPALQAPALTGQLPGGAPRSLPKGPKKVTRALESHLVRHQAKSSHLTFSISLQTGVEAPTWECTGSGAGPRDTPTVHRHWSQHLGWGQNCKESGILESSVTSPGEQAAPITLSL